jgi:hypothetical protein
MEWRVRGSKTTRAQRKAERERWQRQAVVRPALKPTESAKPDAPPAPTP